VISEILRLDKVISRVPLNSAVPVTTTRAEDEVEEEVDVMERLLSDEISKCPTNDKIKEKGERRRREVVEKEEEDDEDEDVDEEEEDEEILYKVRRRTRRGRRGRGGGGRGVPTLPWE